MHRNPRIPRASFLALGLLLAAPPSGPLADETGSPAAPSAAPLLLVTEAEIAALPGDTPVAWGGSEEQDDGPVIAIESPENQGTYNGAFPIHVRFETGPTGHPVDMNSLKLVYKKAWGIDITDRVRAYIAGTEIDVENSELPRGRHTVEIEISDTEGNKSRRFFTVTVV